VCVNDQALYQATYVKQLQQLNSYCTKLCEAGMQHNFNDLTHQQ